MSGRTTDAEPAAEDLTQLRAPEEFRRAIVKDPYASIYRFDFDAARGPRPIPVENLPRGGDPVLVSGYYFDLDGQVINWYRAGDVFPKYAPGRGPGGRYFFLTDRRDATVADLLWIVLRAGWEGNVLDIHVL
jgi:hypothetical protein